MITADTAIMMIGGVLFVVLVVLVALFFVLIALDYAFRMVGDDEG